MKFKRDALRDFVRFLAELDAKAWIAEKEDNRNATSPSQPERTQANSGRFVKSEKSGC